MAAGRTMGDGRSRSYDRMEYRLMRHHSVAWIAAAIVVVATLTACGEASDTAWQGTVRDSAGITVVSNTAGSIWGSDDAWIVEEELRIGTAEGEPELMFGQIVGVDVGLDGRVYVMDQQAHEVRVFSPDGHFLTAMGKAGGGPGELSQNAGPVFITPGDTVVVPDIMLQRITLYTAAGEPAGSVPLSLADGIPTRWLKAANHDLVQQSMIMAMPGQADVQPRNLILRRDPRGSVLDTLLVMPAGESVDFSGGQPRMTLFAPEPTWALAADDRVIHGNSAEYRFRVNSLDGDVERIVEKRAERRPLTAGDQEEFRRVIRWAWQQAGMPPEAMEMMSQALNFAEYYPAYANLLGGPDGTIWVQSVQTPETVRELGGTFDIQDIGGPMWDVFDAEGHLLGTVQMPPRFTPFVLQQDRIYGVVRDDMDVQYVARLRLIRGRGA
jgi:hypothetical protein